jgi:uncharacterized membrane protein
MQSWLPVLASLPFVALLLASGHWANRRFAAFDELPAHYGIDGEPTRFDSRRTMAWMLPVLFSIVLMVIALLTGLLPAEMRNGDPVTGVVVGGVFLLTGQIFVLWLTLRWARKQEGDSR